jgi:hypothetical protein
MIAPLRRRHFAMWIAIAILLPPLVVAAYKMAPRFPVQHFSIPKVSFPELNQSVVTTNYMFNLKKNYTGEYLLEIVQISEINPATELVTISSSASSPKNSTRIMGMMGGNESYTFDLQGITPPFLIEVKDTIKNESLARINF